MAAFPYSSAPKRTGVNRVVWVLIWMVSVALLALLFVGLIIRFTTPIPLFRLRILQDIPLPSALPDPNRTSQNPLAPGVSVRFDHFDFQVLDPQTHLLFINHTGPSPDKASSVNIKVDDASDGNVVVFDTLQRKLVKLLPIPQTSGISLAPDIHWVYTSDANDGIIYGIDEHTFRTVAIKLDPLDSPDASAYDPVDHRLFVSDPGTPDPNSKDQNIALKNQNVAVIDTLHNTLIGKIPLGIDKPFGDDVGHVQYDTVSHRIFVVTLPLHDQNILPNPPVTPPSFVDVIDPQLLKVTTHIKLPDTCLNPHGMVLDTEQREAFVVCVDNDKLVRIDLRTLQPDPNLLQLPAGCDVARLDHPLHLLFIGCQVGIAMFDESGEQLRSLGSQFVGGSSNHTIFINEETQEIYVPITNAGNRPVLRIVQYVPNGTEPSLP